MSTPASAQKLKVHNTYGSPLDTVMSTRLKTDVPEAKDFVKTTSPEEKDLAYTPLTGTDPDRPKPRDAAGIKALQAELEGAAAKNGVKAKGLLPKKSAVARKEKTVAASR